MDSRAGYEQVQVEPSHVEQTAVTPPDGDMVSDVIQGVNCDTPAIYQALMNHIFSPYIGRLLDVYLDDVVIYSEAKQRSLSRRRAHWLEKISESDFKVIYVPGMGNVIADALSHLYSYYIHPYAYFDWDRSPSTTESDPACPGRAETAKEFAARMKDHFVL